MTLKKDYRDICHPCGILALVFDVSERGAGGDQVATEHGINKRTYNIPSDRYAVKADNMTISSELQAVRKRILKLTFDRVREHS